MRVYLQALQADVWEIVEGGYQYPTFIPIDNAGKNQYENNAKVSNAILGRLVESEFVKVMKLSTTKAIWDTIIQSYEGDTKLKVLNFKHLQL